MLDHRIIQGFLKTANVTQVAEETKVSKPTILAMKRGSFGSLQYNSVKQVSDYIERVMSPEDE